MFHLLALAALATAGQPPTADSVAEVARNYPAFARGRLVMTVKGRYDGKESSQVLVRRIHLDPPRWKYVDRATATVMEKGKSVTRFGGSETLFPSSGRITVSRDENGRAVGGVSAHVRPLPPAEAKLNGNGEHEFGVLGGIALNDGNTLVQLLAESPPRVTDDTLDGRSVRVLTSAGRWGKLTVWADPAPGLAAAQGGTGERGR